MLDKENKNIENKKPTKKRPKNFETIRKSFKEYLKYCKENKIRPLSRVLYNDLIKSYSEFMANQLLENGSVHIPSLGVIYFKGIKQTKIIKKKSMIINRPINWKSTKELGRIVYHENLDTDGIVYKITWLKIGLRKLLLPGMYKFTLSRFNKRKLAKMIKEGKRYDTEIYYK